MQQLPGLSGMCTGHLQQLLSHYSAWHSRSAGFTFTHLHPGKAVIVVHLQKAASTVSLKAALPTSCITPIDRSKGSVKTPQVAARAVRTREVRAAAWFERYAWFVSSENCLVLSARDGQQAEQLLKRHMRCENLLYCTSSETDCKASINCSAPAFQH
jgi:hypothetical protein